MESTAAAIAEHVHDRYGVMVTEVVRLEAGADAQATTYRLVTATGRHFLKLRRGSVDATNAELVRFLADVVPAVISPLRACGGELVTHLDGGLALLYPYVDGRNGFDAELTARQWAGLGSTLRAVHGLKLPVALLDGMRWEDFAPTWRDRARHHLARGGGLVPADDVAREVLRLLAARQDQLGTIIDRAERLAAATRAENLPTVLCHGDLHAGNVLVGNGDGGSVSVVDWDDPVMAPKERDLMFVGGGVGGTWGSTVDAAAFHDGYGSAVVNQTAIAYYRYERIVVDIVEYCGQLLTLDETAERVDRERSFQFFANQFEPGNVVELADGTYTRLVTS